MKKLIIALALTASSLSALAQDEAKCPCFIDVQMAGICAASPSVYYNDFGGGYLECTNANEQIRWRAMSIGVLCALSHSWTDGSHSNWISYAEYEKGGELNIACNAELRSAFCILEPDNERYCIDP